MVYIATQRGRGDPTYYAIVWGAKGGKAIRGGSGVLNHGKCLHRISLIRAQILAIQEYLVKAKLRPALRCGASLLVCSSGEV